MPREFKLSDNYNWVNEPGMYKKDTVEVYEGVTILVGCNGAGKTTAIKQMQEQLKKEGIDIFSIDNFVEGGKAGISNLMDSGAECFATAIQSSEGENIIIRIGTILPNIKQKVEKYRKENKEIWVFLDGIDSGLSIDNICTLNDLFDTMTKDYEHMYIIVTTNNYEFARNRKCLDAHNGKYISFKDYEEYREFVIESNKEREKRVENNYKRRKRDTGFKREK